MRLRIISEERELVNEEVHKVTLPGAEGEMTILEGHTKLMSLLKKGVVRYSGGEKEIAEGIAWVEKEQVTIIL